MEQLTTTYTVKMERGDIWRFKYNLNGVLIYFNVLEGDLSEKQIQFLYLKGLFPWKEDHVKGWSKLYKTITVEVGEPDFSFENLWNLYDHKAKKFEAQKAFNKLKEADVIKCFMAIRGYNFYLAKKGTAKALLASFINQRYFEDDWYKAAA
jgi:hypothetical protein